eukprot:gene1420-biopygen1012
MNRRGLVMGAAALAAGATGVALSWRGLQAQGGDAALGDAFWSMQFERPDGSELRLATFRGAPLLLNFWATWCPPCVEELPMLNAFYRQQAPNGWQVLGLAIDQPSAVRKFLQRIPLEFPVGLAGLGGTDLGRSLGNLT